MARSGVCPVQTVRTLLVTLVVLTSAPTAAEPFVVAGEAAPEPAERKPQPGRLDFVVGIYGGTLLPSNEHELYDSTQSFHSPYQSVAPKGGLRLGFFPLTFLGFEAEGGGAPVENERGESHTLFDLRGHAVLQIPWRVTPFVVAGGGLMGVDGETGGDVDEALHWGGGVKVYATPWMTVRVDARHIISSRQGPNSGNTDHFEATAGLGFVLFREDEVPDYVAAVEAPPSGAERARPAPAPEPQVVVVNRTLFVETVEPVRFGFDRAEVPDSFRPLLEKVIRLLAEREELDVVVVGHADAIGSPGYNQLLSERRAEAVAVFMVRRGVRRQRIRLRGEGEGLPIDSNDTDEGRARNRRTEITVVERRTQPEAAVVEARREDELPAPPPPTVNE